MDFMKRATRHLLGMVLMIALGCPAGAASVHIAIPLAPSGQADLAKAIRHALLQHDPALEVRIIAIDTTAPPAEAPAELLITIGEQLLSWAASRRDYGATFCFYTHASRFQQLQWHDQPVTALYREQPLSRQLELARLLLPQLTQLALIYRQEQTPPHLAELTNHADARLTAVDVGGRSNWIRAISELMVEHQALLAVDDPELYNRNTVRSILLTTYRHGRVLIGPSRPFVNAGSLASTYTTSDQYLAQLVEMSARFLRRGELSEPQYPAQFQVAINYQVAASLGLSLPAENDVAAMLRQEEARQ
jgi:hypothetical protein